MGEIQRYLMRTFCSHFEQWRLRRAQNLVFPLFPTFILGLDISPLYFTKPSFLLRQVTCSLRTTLGSDCLEELA